VTQVHAFDAITTRNAAAACWNTSVNPTRSIQATSRAAASRTASSSPAADTCCATAALGGVGLPAGADAALSGAGDGAGAAGWAWGHEGRWEVSGNLELDRLHNGSTGCCPSSSKACCLRCRTAAPVYRSAILSSLLTACPHPSSRQNCHDQPAAAVSAPCAIPHSIIHKYALAPGEEAAVHCYHPPAVAVSAPRYPGAGKEGHCEPEAPSGLALSQHWLSSTGSGE